MAIQDSHGSRSMARLDEQSARRIAAGRLNALQERIRAAAQEPGCESGKPDVRAVAIRVRLERGFVQCVLASTRRGLVLFHLVFWPGEKAGWVDLVLLRHNLRSDQSDADVLAQFSAHATARLWSDVEV